MKKKFVTCLILLFVIINTLFPAFPPSQDDSAIQPLNGLEREWI